MWKRLRGRRRAWLIAPIVLVLAAGGGVWLLTRDSSGATATSTTMTVSSETIQQTVTASGTLAALRSSDESFAVSGTVTKVAVEAGDRVRKGQVLATVGRISLVAARTAAASSLTAAISQLDDDADAGASDVQLAADRAAIVSARATLADAREAVANATLRASIAGTVTSVDLSKGDAVGSGSSSSSSGSGASGSGMGGTGSSSASSSPSSSSSGTISIVSTKSFVVDATVAAEDAEQLKEGLQAEIAATGVDDTVYGTVTEVGLVAQTNDSGAAVFPVTIEVTGKRDDLYAGVSATAAIVVQQRTDVLTVTSRALTSRDGTTYVTAIVDGKEVETAVETGGAYGMSTEILSGLAEGDEVVVPGFTMPAGGDGEGDGQRQGGFPGGGEMPDFSQLPGGGPMGGSGQ